MSGEGKDTYKLFLNGLDVVNQSIEENRGQGVYGKLIEKFDDRLDGHRSAVAVYEDDPANPFDYFTIRYLDGRFELVARGKEDHDTRWRVSREYLESLVDHPKEYIEHPSKLDLDWLKTRLPDSAARLFDQVRAAT